MADYVGKECLVCKQKFTEDDEIVVCPECGTPYHRACYDKEGKCINEDYHISGKSWHAENVAVNETLTNSVPIDKRCPRCGAINQPEDKYCLKCGTPLDSVETKPFNDEHVKPNPYGPFDNSQNPSGQAQQGEPFNPFMQFQTIKDDDELEGVKAKDYANYIGSNKLYFLAQFFRFAKLKIKRSFNFPACFFPEYYYFYRKMNGLGIFYFTLRIAMTIFTNIVALKFGFESSSTSEIVTTITQKLTNEPVWTVLLYASALIYFGLMVFSGIKANYWYYKKAKKDITEIKGEGLPIQAEDEKIALKGGISFILAIVSIVAYFVIMQVISRFIL